MTTITVFIYIRSLKVVKRRGVETILQAVGASEGTADEEYTQSQETLHNLLEDTNEIGAALSAYLTSQKEHVSISNELGQVLHRLYEDEQETHETAARGLTLHDAAVKQREVWSDVHQNYRPSAVRFQFTLQMCNLTGIVFRQKY